MKKPGKTPLTRDALELVAQRFRVLGEAARLQLLQELFAGEATVQDLCRRTGLAQANVSKHLGLMADQGLVARRKDGLFVRYRIVDPGLQELCDHVCRSLSRRLESLQAQLGTG